MAELILPYLGKLSTENLENYYNIEFDFNGNEIQIDLNFENNTIELSKLEKVKNFINNIEEFDNLNKTYILNDYNDEEGDTVKFYLQNHLEEIGKDELSSLINFDNTSIEPEQQLMTKLKLVRVGLYPHDEENFAVFDYSIGEDITNYLLVIFTNENGELNYLTMES